MKTPITIAIADDHQVLREGIISLLKEYDELQVVVSAGDGKELLQALKTTKPDILLLDIEMPVMDGKEALDIIRIKFPKIKTIIMSMHFNDAYIVEFIMKGACGFLPKNTNIEKIVEAIQSVCEHGYYYDQKVSEVMANALKNNAVSASKPQDHGFTRQELRIIKLICDNKSNQQIAEELNLSVRTIEGHRYNICKKTQTNNTMDLVEYVTIHKILEG